MGHCHEMILHCLSPCSEEDDAKFYEDGSCDNSYAVLSLIFLQFWMYFCGLTITCMIRKDSDQHLYTDVMCIWHLIRISFSKKCKMLTTEEILQNNKQSQIDLHSHANLIFYVYFSVLFNTLTLSGLIQQTINWWHFYRPVWKTGCIMLWGMASVCP